MYPYIFGIEWLETYYVMLFIGIVLALVVLRIYSGKLNIPTKVYNFFLLLSLVSIFFGLVFAFAFQQLYNVIDDSINGNEYYPRGMTFMGGLIGGAIVFLLGSKLFLKKEDKKFLYPVINIAAASIAVAHFFGRIGCLFAGCCYGLETNSWIGIKFVTTSQKVIPTQLIEAIFLLLLSGALIFTLEKDKWQYNIIFYAASYAVFRFVIEFWRGDSRGTFLPLFSPSQWQSIFMLVSAFVFLVVKVKKRKETLSKTK